MWLILSERESRPEVSSEICDCLERYAGDRAGNESNGICQMGIRRIGHRGCL